CRRRARHVRAALLARPAHRARGGQGGRWRIRPARDVLAVRDVSEEERRGLRIAAGRSCCGISRPSPGRC
ncbi:MAG: hypothetical protein FJ125_00960, partial [Deltaproteobacteria bacterium]|nr:hypothetical protein [Deltaproteobacteria bacterium]